MVGLGLTSNDDVSSDADSSRIKKNSNDIITIKEAINNTMNSFSDTFG